MSEQQCKTICRSADTVLEQFLSAQESETAHHRMPRQEKKCGFGLQGVCCKLCSNGPCRITPDSPKGVCGADADVMVSRSFLRSVAAGSACYIHLAENAAQSLKDVARRQGPIPGKATLNRLAESLDIQQSDIHKKALLVAQEILKDLHRPSSEKMHLVQKLSHPARLELWAKLGILPGGSKSEVFDALVKTSTNLSNDPVNMLFHSLRLGISTGTFGLLLTSLVGDILYGEPQIQTVPVGFGVIEPGCINILVIGHQVSLYTQIEEFLRSSEAEQIARSAGATGIRLVGSTCVGQELQLRCGCGQSAFCGQAGNNFTTEAILATGCIDMVLTEFNCTLPGVDSLCQEMGIAQICIDEVAKNAHATMLAYSDAAGITISKEIANKAAERFKNQAAYLQIADLERSCGEKLTKMREYMADTQTAAIVQAALKSSGLPNPDPRINPMAHHGNTTTLAGLTQYTLKEFLGGSWQPLINLIVSGAIKGLAGVVGCSNLRTMGHDVFTVEMTKQLIAKDILVLSAGCTSGGLENCGLMSPNAAALAGPKLRAVCEQLGIPPVLNFGACLGIGRLEMISAEIASALGADIPQLPLVVSAPQWLEEQALADGAFALALGLTLHLGSAPFVTGSNLVCDVLLNQMPAITGGRLMIEGDPVCSAELLESVILEKRAALKI